MKRIFLLLILISTFTLSAINECKTDVYFGNGILTDRETAKHNAFEVLKPAIIETFGLDYHNKHIGKVDYAYNSTHLGGIHDLFESLFQKLSVAEFLDKLKKLGNEMQKTAHDADLNLQVRKYEASIRNGHRVLVVAHSQGNLFAYEALRKLPEWMQDYWEAVGIASPGMFAIKKSAPSIGWDNDLVADLALNPARERIHCNVRRVSWNVVSGGLDMVPDEIYLYERNVGKRYGSFRSSEGVLEQFDFNVHAFTFYMGEQLKGLISGKVYKDPFEHKTLTSAVAKNKIMAAIRVQLEKLAKVHSQWGFAGADADNEDEEEKCILKSCDNKRKKFTHRFDPANMDKLLGGALVYPFGSSKNNKLYMVDGAYVFGPCGGTGIAHKPKKGVCFALEGTDAMIEGEDLPANRSRSIRKSISPVSTALSWDKAGDVEMTVSMSKSPGGPPSVGDTYTMSATGSLAADSQITAECLKNDPIHVIAYVSTPNDWGISQYKIVDPGQLTMDPYGIVVIEEKKIAKIKRNDSGGNNSGGNGSSGGNGKPPRKYNKCKKKSANKSCDCVPCKYMVYGMQRTSQYGPIAGGDVTIIGAAENEKANPYILYHTVTTSDRDTLKSGIINIDQDAMDRFDDDQYYIVRVEGGVDIDSDDNFIYDDLPTQNHGTIHAIIKGAELKRMPFVVNVLTEAIYQVSGDMIGERYDPASLEEMLDRSAAKLISTKLDITGTDKEVDYRDILLWSPAADKATLYKPYDLYVQPIVEKTYTDMPRSDESYQLIYGEYNSTMPILVPLSIEIPAGLPNHTPIAKVSVKNSKNYADIEIDGKYSDAFEIGDNGLIRIAKTDQIIEGGYYDLRMRAVNRNGEYGSWAGLLIRVKGTSSIASSAPVLQSVETYPLHENAQPGTIVAKVVFESVGHTVVAYRLQGAFSTLFSIDSNGVVRVAKDADIDYERSSSYRFDIVAVNEDGVESLPFEVKLPVIDELDTPLLPVQMTRLVHENIPIGTEVATIEVLKEGKSPIESFEILSPNTPFAINKSGVIYTTAPIDYEFDKSYTFMAVATSKNGNSNKIKCTMVIKDIEPEPPKATIDDATFRVDENISKGSRIGLLNIHKSDTFVHEIILNGKDAYAFDVDSNGTLYLSGTIGLDYEKQQKYTFGAKTLDATGYGKEAKIVVTVGNVPDTPPTISGFSTKLYENTHYKAQTVLGHIEILDQGEGNITSYELTGEQSSLFIIDDNGTVMLKEDMMFDYETKAQYQFFATVTNLAGRSKPAAITLNIADEVDTPPTLFKSRLSVEENASSGTKIGVIKVPSIYQQDINYTIVKDPLHVLSIDNNGTVYLRQEGVLDYEKSTSYLFEVAASNRFGTSIPVQQKVRIINTGTTPVVEPIAIYVPFDRDLIAGLWLGTLHIDSGDGTINAIELSGDGSEHFAVDLDGNITLKNEMDPSVRSNFNLKVKASNEFGTSIDADLNITFEPKPNIDAGDDMALYANEAFSLNGTIDEAYRDKIKEIRWSSPQTGKINCIETNTTLCKITEGLPPSNYSVLFTVTYQSGWQQTDSLTIKVEPNPFDNVLSVIEKPILGLKKMLFSKDRSKIYAVGDFEGGDIFKIIDVSDPQNIQIITSFAYGGIFVKGEDIALNADETKAAIVANGRLIVLDISDPDSIAMIASRYEYWNQYAHGVEWYRNNQIIIKNWNNEKDYASVVIVDADTMDGNQTIPLKGGWVGNMRAIADRSLLVYSDNAVLKIYDINQSKIVYEGNNTEVYDFITDKNATHIVYRGDKRVYDPKWGSYDIENYFGSLDISDIDHIVEREIGSGVLSDWGDDTPYSANAHSVAFFSGSSNYSVLKELNIDDIQHSTIAHVLQIKGDIKNIIEDKGNQVVYVYASDGLKAISEKSISTAAKFVYRLDRLLNDRYLYPVVAKDNFLYLSGAYNLGNSIYDVSNPYKPKRVGAIELQKSCYPDCGIENSPMLGVESAKILDDQMHVVSSGSPIDHWTIDLSDKNQTISLELPQRYDYAWSIGESFEMTKDKRYIYAAYTTEEAQNTTRQGLSVLDTETKQQNDFVFGDDYASFSNLALGLNEKYLYALLSKRLYGFDIQEKMYIKQIMKTKEGAINTFVISKSYNKIYALSDNAINVYNIESSGVLKESSRIPLQSTILPDWQKDISISPDEQKLLISTKYGLRLYPIEAGVVQSDTYVDINYPDTTVNTTRIAWIDNVTFVADGYIVRLER